MIPTPLAPTDSVVGYNDPATFSWSGGGSQAAFTLQARIQGTSSWTVDTGLVSSGGTPSTTLPAGTLTSGEWEWRVGVLPPTSFPSATTYPGATLFPAYGGVGSLNWSPSGFFAARLRPDAPSITAPTEGQTITQARPYVTWTSPTHPAVQGAFQVQRLVPLTGEVREDSGTVTGTALTWRARHRTNNVARSYRVRVRHDDLWSPWASVSVFVFFVGPPTPEPWTVASDDAAGCIVVTITNPDSAPGQPLLSEQEVWRRVVGESGDGIRRAVLAGNVTWSDHFVAAGVNYEYKITALAANGDATETDWQE